jgi:hypothetical protein
MPLGDQGLEDVILRLPASLRSRVEEMANRECLSLNLFVLMAIAEKLQRLQLQHCMDTTDREDAPADAFRRSLIH